MEENWTRGAMEEPHALEFQRVLESALADIHGILLDAHSHHLATSQQKLGAPQEASNEPPKGCVDLVSWRDMQPYRTRSLRGALRPLDVEGRDAGIAPARRRRSYCSNASETLSDPQAEERAHRPSLFPAASNAKLSEIVKNMTDQTAGIAPKDEVFEIIHDCRNPTILLQSFIGLVIVVNAITIGVSMDVYPDSPVWFAVDAVFALIFVLEMLLKMRPGCSVYFCGDDRRWNRFECLLVVFALVELVFVLLREEDGDSTTAMLSIIRTIRLARIFRLARLARLQLFKELFTMIVAASGGVKVLLWSFLLIALPIYVIAMALTEVLGSNAESGHGAECFADLKTSFFTVFRCLIAGDCTTTEGKPIFYLITVHYGWQYSVIYGFSLMVMIFGFFNVITAVFVDNIMTSARFSDTQRKYERLLDTDMFNQKASDLVEFIWNVYAANNGALQNGSDVQHAMKTHITPQFFDDLMKMSKFKDILSSLDIAYEDQIDLFDTLDVDGGGTIDMEEMIMGIAKLRGDARRTDVVGVSLVVRAMQAELCKIREYVESSNNHTRCIIRRLRATGVPELTDIHKPTGYKDTHTC